MFDQRLIPAVQKTIRETRQQVESLVDLTQQERSAIRTDRPAVETGHDLQPPRMRRMMCLPLCSNVGLGSSVLRTHTGPLADLFDVILVVLERDLVLPEIFFHPFGHHRLQAGFVVTIVQPLQRTTENQPVKAAHDTSR
jgi:hypothetical protein